MIFLCADDDFVVRTLGALRGCWARLVYTAELRQADGRYEHWGFIRTHGEQNSQAAIERAHRQMFREVLRRPISELANGDALDRARAALAGRLNLLPNGTRRAARLHFTAVAFALSQVPASNPAASPAQPPGQ